jgi:predicted nuclease of predicted toxin-antitoxin system
VKLLVDMNLPLEWIGRLAQRGYEAVHWSTVGAVTATDHEILTWATDHRCVVLTHDLDFAAILAATSDRAPSVVQLRIHDVLAETSFDAIAAALGAHAEQLAIGALLSIDETGARVRILPLRRR